MEPDNYQYADFAREIISNKQGVRIQDLRIGDSVHLYFEHEPGHFCTDMIMEVTNPYSAEVFAYSTSNFAFYAHVRTVEGVCLRPGTGSTVIEGWLVIGHRLAFSPFIFPMISKIEVNGYDISEKPVSDNN